MLSHKTLRGRESVLFSERLACPVCGLSFPELEPRQFSFNSPFGACPACHGVGTRWVEHRPARQPYGPSGLAQGLGVAACPGGGSRQPGHVSWAVASSPTPPSRLAPHEPARRGRWRGMLGGCQGARFLGASAKKGFWNTYPRPPSRRGVPHAERCAEAPPHQAHPSPRLTRLPGAI